ncbi:MAG: AI-2E family transporter [Rhizomicrobium sp.]
MERFSFSESLRRAAVWLGLGVALFLLWRLRPALLLVFGAYLLSLLLRLLASLLGRIPKLPRAGALALAVLIVFGLGLGAFWLFGESLASQLHSVFLRVQEGYRQLEALLRKDGVDISSLTQSIASLSTAQIILSLILGSAEVVVILVILALYLAAEPELYHHGIALLFPKHLRAKALEAVDGVGSWLELWMLGQLCLMAIVGLGSYVALALIGIGNAGALGLIAGLAEAIPYLGPFIGAVPALLVALTHGLRPAISTAGAYLALHIIEGYVAGPALQRRFARIPPALILSGIFACQLIFGFGGLILAAPLTVAFYATANILYLRNALHQPVQLPEAPKLEP